ncbi:MAG: type II secretion system F family protein [Acidimicrobiia bacterium]
MRAFVDHSLRGRPVLTSFATVLLIQRPFLLGLAGGALGFFHLWKRRSTSRARSREVPLQQALLARILLVGLTAGLPLASALELGRGFVRGDVANETATVVRRARRQGMALALTESGPLTRPMLSRLALAAASGAPVAEAVADHLVEMRQLRRTAALERIRRLPVTLMIPLGLLILPGFVVLFVGPIVYRSFGDLVGALP